MLTLKCNLQPCRHSRKRHLKRFKLGFRKRHGQNSFHVFLENISSHEIPQSFKLHFHLQRNISLAKHFHNFLLISHVELIRLCDQNSRYIQIPKLPLLTCRLDKHRSVKQLSATLNTPFPFYHSSAQCVTVLDYKCLFEL